MWHKLCLIGLVVALLMVTMPAPAYASEKVPVNCTLTLAVVDPGTISMKGNSVKTSGEKTAGALDCDIDIMDGAFSTVHSSKVKVNQDNGSFKGKLKGTFTLVTADGTLTGKIRARIKGQVIGAAPTPPFPPGTPIHRVMDNGKWKINDDDLKAKGVFEVTMTGVVGLPASLGGLSGGGTMGGVLKADD